MSEPWILSIRNIVFSGGAQKGNAFVGALQVLDETWRLCGRNLFEQIEGYGGTSIGSLVALSCAMQIPILELRSWFLTQDTNTLMGKIDVTRFYTHCGLLKSDIIKDRILQLMSTRFSQPEKVTFLDLYRLTRKVLRIVTANLTRNTVEVFDHRRSPSAYVADAVTKSMCMPFLFEPVRQNDQVYIDGGYFSNYRPTLFPSQTMIGFRVNGENLLSPEFSIKEYANFMWVNQMCYYENQLLRSLPSEYQERTVSITLPPSTFWDMINADVVIREQYMKAGEETMNNFLFRGFFMGQMLLWVMCEMQTTPSTITYSSTTASITSSSTHDQDEECSSCNTELPEEYPLPPTNQEQNK